MAKILNNLNQWTFEKTNRLSLFFFLVNATSDVTSSLEILQQENLKEISAITSVNIASTCLLCIIISTRLIPDSLSFLMALVNVSGFLKFTLPTTWKGNLWESFP